MATMNRELQRELLQSLEAEYPEQINVLERCARNPMLAREIAYLAEHGLIVATPVKAMNAPLRFAFARLTAKGRDFLADDGGLSAILDVLTIRLHDDTVRGLIESKITASTLPQSEKRRYLDRLRSLPADATKHLALKLLDLGMDHLPDALKLLDTLR